MSRVERRTEDWAPAQEARISANWTRTQWPGDESGARWFPSRKQSIPLGRRDTNLAHTTMSSITEADAGEEHGKKPGGFRGLVRKVSVSMSMKKRRHSHAVEERPHTAWNKLKTAASFHRHSKLIELGPFQESLHDSHQEIQSPEALSAPIPGSGNAPPYIPLGHGGEAARSAAASQNEYLGNLGRNRQLYLPDESFGDRESGIEIPVTSTDLDDESVPAAVAGYKTIDFINILPQELAVQVLSHLDHKALIRVSQVCRSWHRMSGDKDVWREVFMRDQTKTYATGKPLPLGAGLGLPTNKPENDWEKLYKVREQLRGNWRLGTARPTYLSGHLDSIYCVQFDENKIITGSRDKTIRIWDMKTYTCTLVIGPEEVVRNPATMVDNDGNFQHYATTQSGDEDLSIYQSNPPTISFPICHNQSILCLQYDQNIMVTGSSDGTCIVHDVKNGYTPIRRLVFHTAAVLDLAFDDRYIVTCSKDVSICVWDRHTGAMLKQLKGHEGPVNAVQLRGNTIVSCSGDFTVKLWNIESGKVIKELSGHTKGLACSQFSEDSRYIASAGNDKIIRIWDANTGDCLKNFEAHENLVRSLHVDSISGRLISGSYDQDIKVFDMNTGSLLLDFPKWHSSWVLGAKSDYRRIISTGQDPKILVMDFGASVEGIELLESDY